MSAWPDCSGLIKNPVSIVIIEKSSEPIMAPQRLLTSKPLTNHPVAKNTTEFITKVNSPNDNIFIGKVNKIISGLIKVLIKAITAAAAASIKTPRKPGSLTFSPLTVLTMTKSTAVFISHLAIKGTKSKRADAISVLCQLLIGVPKARNKGFNEYFIQFHHY